MGQMPEAERTQNCKLRSDQRYLFEIVQAIHMGNVTDALAARKPGKVHKARWITMASRILRLYVTKSKPDKELQMFAEYIMKVYAPFWFAVKLEPLATKGSRHVFKMMQWIRQLPEDIQKVVRGSIQINGFFCHPESILLSMITDDDENIRDEALKKILKARSVGGEKRRCFVVPKNEINFECTHYHNMIDWKKVTITEPPILQFHSNDYLRSFISSDQIIDIPG